MVPLGGDAPPGGEETQAKQPRCGGDADGGITEGGPGLRRHSGRALKHRWDSARRTRWGGHAGRKDRELPVGGLCAEFRGAQGVCGAPTNDFQNLENCGSSRRNGAWCLRRPQAKPHAST